MSAIMSCHRSLARPVRFRQAVSHQGLLRRTVATASKMPKAEQAKTLSRISGAAKPATVSPTAIPTDAPKAASTRTLPSTKPIQFEKLNKYTPRPIVSEPPKAKVPILSNLGAAKPKSSKRKRPVDAVVKSAEMGSPAKPAVQPEQQVKPSDVIMKSQQASLIVKQQEELNALKKRVRKFEEHQVQQRKRRAAFAIVLGTIFSCSLVLLLSTEPQMEEAIGARQHNRLSTTGDVKQGLKRHHEDQRQGLMWRG